MRRRWLAAFGLAFAVGCSGSGHSAHDDASADATTDGALPDGAPSNHDARRDVTVIGGGGARGDARLDADGDMPEVAPDAGDASVEARDASDASEVPVQSNCPGQISSLVVGGGPVTGVLAGPSNNPIVSCQGGIITDGPDAFYTMTLTQATTVELHVTAPVETVIAVRTGPCSDSISEVACGQDPELDVLPSGAGGAAGFDDGFEPTGGAGFFFEGDASSLDPIDASAADASSVDAAPASDGGAADADGAVLPASDLRVHLAAGTYTVVVDTFGPAPQTPSSYTLTATAVAPLANGTCGTPTLLASGDTATDQPLDLAGTPMTVCGTTRSALFYSVGVPPGQRLTARATPKLGDRGWMPNLMAFTACSSSACLAQGHTSAGTTQQLDWTNNGTDWQLVDLAVMADGPVTGATFDLNVVVIDLTATCARPTPIKDGTALLGQDLSIALSTTTNPCTGGTTGTFFYAATLLPQQTAEVFVEPSSTTQNNGQFFINVNLISSCDATAMCQGNGNTATFTNISNATSSALFEVSASFQGSSTTFDLHVSIPLPPAHIVVKPTSGLVTSESGQTATFQVVLTSPPTSNVSIAVASDTPTEGTASPSTLTFTPTNWNLPQTVTVTGVDDSVPDGTRKYMIVTSPAVSADGRYQGLNPDDVSASNLDNDPGLTLVGADDVVTSESGATATFTVQLNRAPTSSVTVPLSSSNLAEGNVSPASLVFTTANWSVPQPVTVTGVDDSVADGTQAYTIVTGALVSSDPAYSGQNPPDVTAHNRDDDYAAVGVKLISSDHSCGVGNRFPIAVDEFNEIYIVMECETGLWLTTSTDGGATFTEPVLIPNTGTAVGFEPVELGAGIGGSVYLAFEDNTETVSFLRSTDGGVTWSMPMTLTQQTNNLHLASAKQTVAVLTDASTGGQSSLLWTSIDGGATFPSPTFIADSNLSLGVSLDGTMEWLLEQLGTNLSKSLDDGQTFSTIGSIGFSIFPAVFGKNSVFGFNGDTLVAASLTDTTMVQQPAVSLNGPSAIALDDVDTATVIDSDPNSNRMRATHVVASAATPITGQLSVGPNAGPVGVVTLSRKASAIAFASGSVMLFTTVVFP